jgi:hypothetical protein
LRQIQLIEKHLRHAGVIVLAGVNAICANSSGRRAISRRPVLSRALSLSKGLSKQSARSS